MHIESLLPDNALLALLQRCALPTSDIATAQTLHFYGCRHAGALLATVALEVHAEVALLRSLAVTEQARHAGLGRALVRHAEDQAAAAGIERLFLLTTTAATFFTDLGYRVLNRDQAPAAIRSTAQFAELCPASSTFMGKGLAG